MKKGREHWRTAEEYLEDRGWLFEYGSWVHPKSHQTYNLMDAIARQVYADQDPEEGGKVVTISITTEPQ